MTGVALATLGAGIINSAGQIYTNNVNAQNQSSINAANIAAQMAINDSNLQATAINNQTAINLANTAHQREVQDLRDAGLNPILSANGNGSDVPSLSSPNLEAPMSQAATISNPMAGIASALTGLRAAEDRHAIDQAQAQMLQGALPSDTPRRSGVEALREQALAETASATAHARAMTARDNLLAESAERELSILRAGKVFGRNGEVSFISPKMAREYQDLIDEGIMSRMKDQSNINWRNNVNTMGNAVNSASKVIPSARAIQMLRK